MKTYAVGFPVDLAGAVAWAAESLDRGELDFGSDLCDRVRARLDVFTSARLLVSPEWSSLARELSSAGHHISGSSEVAAQFLGELRRRGARTVVVESDMESRRDPRIDPGAAFLGDRVERWSDLRDPRAAASLLGIASWPLNAFVSDRSADDLGLSAGAELGETEVALIAESSVALINQVFDDEAYVSLVRDF